MTLYEKLKQANLPVISATEDGAIAMGNMTEEQKAIFDDIINPPDYSELRRRAYPPIDEQLDMQYHDQEDGTTTWHDLIESIKLKYPKE